jgi:pyruvate,water dikinase
VRKLLELFGGQKVCELLRPLEGKHAARYTHFRALLRGNQATLHRVADLQELYYGGKPFTLQSARRQCLDLVSGVRGVVASLQQLSGKEQAILSGLCSSIEREIREELSPARPATGDRLTLDLDEVTPERYRTVGNKAANLAAMRNVLHLRVPDGFALTALAFERFVEHNGLGELIEDAFSNLDPESPGSLESNAASLQEAFGRGEVPQDVDEALARAYVSLESRTHAGVRLAMRSSAAREDTEATFAGQYRTVLNVTSTGLLEAYKAVLASKYSPRAISYRMQYGLDDRETPMCVVGLAMVEAQASGVLYTRDPSEPSPESMKIHAVRGLGELLVDGSGSPDTFLVDRAAGEIRERSVGLKEEHVVALEGGGTERRALAPEDRDRPAIGEEAALQLAEGGVKLEAHFGGPQDVEWAVDGTGSLYFLQSRPLGVHVSGDPEEEICVDGQLHPPILTGGVVASPGVASGRVWLAREDETLANIPEDAVLVAPTASPDYARVIHRLRGVVTDMGSGTSHLAAVAREFGVPALMDTKNATSVLKEGQTVTLWVGNRTVYEGNVEALVRGVRRVRRPMFESPGHLRLARLLERISPLNLTDPQAESFSPSGCRTLHDIIRFAHEQAMKEMFGYADAAERMPNAVKLTGNIPLLFRLIDLGGGLKEGLTTCDTVTAESVASTPFRAVWKGFIHPGVTWTGAIDVTPRNVMTLIASSVTAGMDGPPGAEAYALLSGDYANVSARFGYHFATLDTLCGAVPDQNYVALQFSGGAGPVYGRVLRVQFLGNVLRRLGFEVNLTGDLLEATLLRHDRASTENKLDQLGRLLACSHLLDMAIRSQEDVERLTESFFREEYNLLARKVEGEPEGFYIHGGHWKVAEEEGETRCLQDGSQWGVWLGAGVATIMGKMMGSRYQEFLDTIGAYYYFPLAIAKESWMTSGRARVRVKPVSGSIDQAGGLAFGIRDINNYFVFRVNALENNAILFEFQRGKRIQRMSVELAVESNQWHDLAVEVEGGEIRGLVDGQEAIRFVADRPVEGYLGIWTKADSVTAFGRLHYETPEGKREVAF